MRDKKKLKKQQQKRGNDNKWDIKCL